MAPLPVRDGALHFGGSLESVARGLYQDIARRAGATVPPLSDVADVPPVPARVNANRWIVDCPDCGGAEFAHFETPLMFCASCFNAAIGGGWRPVSLPRQRAAIEKALRARPLPHTRNWRPGEPVSQLQRENKDRGLYDEATI